MEKPLRTIFFKPAESTHYKAMIKRGPNTVVKDPYNCFQAKGTHGFCQMFAFFLVMEDTRDFEIVGKQTMNDPIDQEKFEKLARNTQMCAKKTLDLIESDRDLLRMFEKEFEKVRAVPRYGVQLHANTKRYLQDFRTINSDLKRVKDYIIYQPLNWGRQETRKRKDVFDSFHPASDVVYFPADTSLCVHPTEGETQYDSFLSIMTEIMAASEPTSPEYPTLYDLLLHKYEIVAVPQASKPTVAKRRTFAESAESYWSAATPAGKKAKAGKKTSKNTKKTKKKKKKKKKTR